MPLSSQGKFVDKFTWRVKDPRSICQKCRWQVTPKHAYTVGSVESEWADYSGPGIVWEPIRGNEFSRNLSGNTQPQSSQLAESLWTDPGLKSGIGVCV